MPTRLRLALLAAALACVPPLKAADLDGSDPAVGAAEAARLYREANDYVANVGEGGYSYAYIQFYWKRAQGFVDRAARVYPDSPTARDLRAGRLKLGPYDAAYFRDRVLPRLEEKRTYTVDAVTCANFLYELDPARADPARLAAFESIIETMARQQRWGEIAAFPAPGPLRVALLRVMFRTAARDRHDTKPVLDQLLATTSPQEQAAAGFSPSLAEGWALLGRPRAELAAYVASHPEPAVKLAALRGMATREARIRRAAAFGGAVGDRIEDFHYVLLNLAVRDDVEAAARGFFPAGLPPEAETVLAAYRAWLGAEPPAGAGLEARLAYVGYLGAFERFEAMEAYALSDRGSPAEREACRLEAIERYAEAGRLEDAARLRAGAADPDQAEFAEFRGRAASVSAPLTIHEKTFATLPLRDPCVLARAIMEWSLAPVRSIRGAAPWDAVVLKYEPGFADLPPPKSGAIRRAASSDDPY